MRLCITDNLQLRLPSLVSCGRLFVCQSVARSEELFIYRSNEVNQVARHHAPPFLLPSPSRDCPVECRSSIGSQERDILGDSFARWWWETHMPACQAALSSIAMDALVCPFHPFTPPSQQHAHASAQDITLPPDSLQSSLHARLENLYLL